MRLREAAAGDIDAIAEFTQDTFAWGDYVSGAFSSWLGTPNSQLLVAVDDDDRAVGLARARMLSDHEVWLHAARVHPEHRGQGIAGALNRALMDWGGRQGGQVVRLLIEDWNEAAQRQVAKEGYRAVSQWNLAHRQIGPGDPNPRRNGGRRVPGPERLQRAASAEAEPAYLAWAAGELHRRARGLFGRGWSWRRLVIDDLVDSAKDGAFLHCPSGWVLTAEGPDERLDIEWFMATPDDFSRLVRATLDHALTAGAAGLRFFVPAIDALDDALVRIGCELERAALWERALNP